MTLPPVHPAPSPLPIAPPRALWQRALGSISDTLAPADSSDSAALDNWLCRVIALHDTALFDSLLPLLRAPSYGPPPPLPHALNRAMGNDKIYYLRGLLDAGANPNELLSSDNARLLIHEAARRGSLETLSLLIERSAFLDLPDARGSTPLMLAASNASPEHVQALILAGANLNLRNLAGLSALDLSIRDFPARDPLISNQSPRKIELSELSYFIRPLLPQAEIAAALLNAGAELPDPIPFLAFCARLREPRLLQALAKRGFCSELATLAKLTNQTLPSSPCAHNSIWPERLVGKPIAPSLWASYLQTIAGVEPQIETFFNFALEEQASRSPSASDSTHNINSASPANTPPSSPFKETDFEAPSFARKILSSRSP